MHACLLFSYHSFYQVAYCDTQSHKLSASVRRMKPTADQSNPQCPSDSPSSPSVLDELPGVLAAFSAYADYLYCWASYYQGARVGAGDNGRSAKRASVCVSAVNVTKSIMRLVDGSEVKHALSVLVPGMLGRVLVLEQQWLKERLEEEGMARA